MNLDLEQLTAITGQAEMIFSPVEMHGVLAGLLVVDKALTEHQYLECLVGQDPTIPLTENVTDALQQLLEDTKTMIESDNFEFEPLLPDDGYALADRLNAASGWARGFILGLSRQGVNANKITSPDVSQFIHDLTEISTSEYEVDDSEESELIYVELVEYLRMGAILLQEELQPVATTQPLH